MTQQMGFHRCDSFGNGGMPALVDDAYIAAAFAVQLRHAHVHALPRPCAASGIVGDIGRGKSQTAAQTLAAYHASVKGKQGHALWQGKGVGHSGAPLLKKIRMESASIILHRGWKRKSK